jgi:glycosyltransferase involved in cell wall biosynthesis
LPRFSLFMPTKDRPGLILEAIAAVQAQTFQDWELLIEDGGESVEHLLPRDNRIRYFRQKDADDQRGDMVLRMAQGDLLSFQADDDTLLPMTLSEVSEAFWSRERAGMIQAQWLYGRVAYGETGLTMGDDWDFERLKQQNFVPAPAVFWTRHARDVVGGWDRTNPRAHDWDYWLRLGARWRPMFMPQILANYRVHPGMATATMSDEFKREQDLVILGRARVGYYDAI